MFDWRFSHFTHKILVIALFVLIICLRRGDGKDNPDIGEQDIPSVVPAWAVGCNSQNAHFGKSVSSAGDVNGDGYEDIIVGEPDYQNQGRVLVYYGTSSGLPAAYDWVANGSQAGAHFGYSVACAGDVNGDGYDDVIVGMPDDDVGGHVYAYYGSASGLYPWASWSTYGSDITAHFGFSVSGAGDVNGDGYDDIIIGAPDYWIFGKGSIGLVRIYGGSENGLEFNPLWDSSSSLAQGESLTGYSVSAAGDVNGDGYDEIIIGAPDYYEGQASEGAVFAFYGSSSGPSYSSDWEAYGNQAHCHFGFSVSNAGDLNSDGYDDVIIGAPDYDVGGRAFVYYGSPMGLSIASVWSQASTQLGARFGCSVSAAGYVNSDAFPEIIVGCEEYSNGEPNEGGAFLYLGSSLFPADAPVWVAEGNQDSCFFGNAVASADVNGNGFSDVIIGAYSYDCADSNAGKAFVYMGGSAVGIGNAPVPPSLVLYQNFPNPFSSGTTIPFSVGSETYVDLSVFDARGGLVRKIVENTLANGYREYYWDGRDTQGNLVSSGIYFCCLKTSSQVRTRKMALLH